MTIGVSVGDDLTIEVVDNGCGIGDEITASGLANLRQRAEDVGGSFSVQKAEGGGTRLRWCAPLP